MKDTNTWVDVLGLSGELVYQLIRDNKVVYYGITSRTALERMAEHGKTKVFDNIWKYWLTDLHTTKLALLKGL